MVVKASPKGHSVHAFENYPASLISRSVFDRSHGLITSMNSGYLIPIYYDFAYPADTLKMSCSAFARLATQIVPFMDNVYMDVHFWAVPLRLVWSHWVNFMGEQPAKYDPSDPLDGTDYLTPQLTTTSTSDITVGSIFDYFGITPSISGISFNSFNFRAYNLIWNEWYRDENLQDPVTVRLTDDGTDSLSDFTLLKRGKHKDYFTSCLPFPQKGPAVDLPLGLTAPMSQSSVPVIGDGNALGLTLGTGMNTAVYTSGSTGVGYLGNNSAGVGQPFNSTDTSGNVYNTPARSLGLATASNMSGVIADVSGLTVDLSNATASTINGLRQAFAIQRLFEKDARGGVRYTEQILSHFGVKSADSRLQRPEFLGGATFNLNMSVVPQTSNSASGVTPQGNLSSFATVNGTSSQIVHSFTEHCLVIGLASIRADLTYQQGLDREYSRRERFDFYYPTLANLGEQAVLNKEIFVQGSGVTDSDGNIVDDQVFGYQERWAELRYKQNRITGQLRSDAGLSLDIWHLSQDFSSLPALNSSFIEENPPISRVIAVTGANVPEFISNFYFNEIWVRPLPVYSIPSMSSHF